MKIKAWQAFNGIIQIHSLNKRWITVDKPGIAEKTIVFNLKLYDANSGYSGTPLVKKLGIKRGMKLLLIHCPDEYFNWLEQDIFSQLIIGKEIPDLIHLFVHSKREYEQEMKKMDPVFK
jgi:hypothetical protein